jgi:hypothetical protein
MARHHTVNQQYVATSTPQRKAFKWPGPFITVIIPLASMGKLHTQSSTLTSARRSPWQATTNTVIIPTSGYYYIEVAFETRPGPADMRVVLNGAVTISRVLLGFSADWVGRSRSVLMQLHTGDQLVVTCTSCTISGDTRQGISFMGVLLYQTTW